MLLTCFAGFACSRPSHAAADLPAPNQDIEIQPGDEPQSVTSVLGGGCFWCTEAVFEQLHGVSAVVSGYAGGAEDTANYQLVGSGATKHAEVIAITYDPTVISYGQLLQVFFSAAHDPTQINRQGNDIGPQYRSAVFYANEDEKRVAEAYIAQLNEAGVFDQPIATTLEPLTQFHEAEAYHQDYARLNPRQGYVAGVALPKVDKVRKHFAEWLKDDTAAK
ncbi:MAG: peptide-methionine (S)-S-oxide reductase MsrA [Planctomycetota bacterium]